MTAVDAGDLLRRVDACVTAAGDALVHFRAGMQAFLHRGKRLRSRLLLCIGVAGPAPDCEALVRFGAFVELIHAGGLCHDDVVDRCPTRRGTATIGRLYGVPAATHAGLYLMAHGFELMAAEDKRTREWVAEAAMRVARGQAREMCDLYREDVSFDEYVARIEDKTAALFELAARLGAIAGKFEPNEREALARYGRCFGMAFQLADDVRDVMGNAAPGRACGTDVREGVYTLPILFTLGREMDGADELRTYLRRVRIHRRQADIERCCAIVLENGAVRETRRAMERYVAEAVTVSGGCPARLNTVLREVATQLTEGLTDGGQAPC